MLLVLSLGLLLSEDAFAFPQLLSQKYFFFKFPVKFLENICFYYNNFFSLKSHTFGNWISNDLCCNVIYIHLKEKKAHNLK